MRQLFRRNVEQHVAAFHVGFVPALRKVAHCCSQLAVRATELLEQHLCKVGIRLVDSNRVHHSLVVEKHSKLPMDSCNIGFYPNASCTLGSAHGKQSNETVHDERYRDEHIDAQNP